MATRYILAIIAIMATLAVCFSADYGNATVMPAPEKPYVFERENKQKRDVPEIGFGIKPTVLSTDSSACPDNR